MWGYTGSASGTSHPPALAFALVQHLLCRLDGPWGAHQHLLPQLQHWTCLAPCKWMGKGPASPSGASSVVTTMVLALDPTPIGAFRSKQAFILLFFLCGSCSLESASHPLIWQGWQLARSFTKAPPSSFCFAYLPGLLSQKDEQGEMISSGEPFFLSKVIWERICYITTLLLNCQPDTWEHS